MNGALQILAAVAPPLVMAIATGIILAWTNFMFRRKEMADGKREAERIEHEKKIESLIKERDERREVQRDKEYASLHNTLCAVKAKVDKIEHDMHDKVTLDYCKQQERIIQKRITEHIEVHHIRRSTDRWPMGEIGESKDG